MAGTRNWAEASLKFYKKIPVSSVILLTGIQNLCGGDSHPHSIAKDFIHSNSYPQTLTVCALQHVGMVALTIYGTHSHFAYRRSHKFLEKKGTGISAYRGCSGEEYDLDRTAEAIGS